MGQEIKFNHAGREYTVYLTQVTALMSEDLKRRGFDGVCYFAESLPIGRQRKEMKGMFFRSAKSGDFISAI